MSRYFIKAAFAIAFLTTSVNLCSAQYNIDLAGVRRQQQESLNAFRAHGDWIDQYQTSLQQSMISGYRQQTGDYSTPDAQVYGRMQREYFAQNPEAYRQRQAEDQHYAQEMARINGQMSRDTLEQFGRRSQIIANTYSDINAMSMRGFNNQMASMDRMQAQNVNGTYEQSRYVNPSTGQAVDLSFHPQQFQQVGGQSYYTDNGGQQYQWVPNEGFQLLDDGN